MNWGAITAIYCSASSVTIAALVSLAAARGREIKTLKATLSKRCGHYRPERADFGRLHRIPYEKWEVRVSPLVKKTVTVHLGERYMGQIDSERGAFVHPNCPGASWPAGVMADAKRKFAAALKEDEE